MLLTHTPGYLLHVEPGTIDLNLFTLHTERGRSYAADANWESARQELRNALGVWRGPVLADLTEACTVWPEAVAVQNMHLVVLEELFDAELACGRHREVVAELESVAGRELSHERLVAQLMLALYRCGRQLDALDVYRRARVSLIEPAWPARPCQPSCPRSRPPGRRALRPSQKMTASCPRHRGGWSP